VARAIVTDLRTWSLKQGASTITMQMVGNVIVGRKKDWTLKVRAALMAFQAEGSYSKDQILEFYLNQIPFGHYAFGVQAAAQTYFGKDAADLTVSECATLAAIPNAPGKLNPIINPEGAFNRRNKVLGNMLRLNMIDEETYEHEKATPITPPPDNQHRISYPYFIDHVQRVLKHNPNLHNLQDDILTSGGYCVHSTVNTQYQQVLEAELPKALADVEKLWQKGKSEGQHESGRLKAGQMRLAHIREVKDDGVDVDLEGQRLFVPYLKVYQGVDEQGEKKWTGRYRKPYYDPDDVLKKGEPLDVRVKDVDEKTGKVIDISMAEADTQHIQGAAIVLDVKTGHVLALVGGNDFYDGLNNGMYNRATQGEGRQPGSTFKPFTYSAAISAGRTLATTVVDQKYDYNGYSPKNYENTYSNLPTTLYWALTESNNNVTVRVFYELGFKRAFRFFQDFDIVLPNPTWVLKPELPLCLGTLSCTPLAMAAAYLPFARQGLGIEPLAVTRVTDLEGKPITVDGSTDVFRPRERPVLSPEVAYLVTSTLMEVAREGTGKGVGKFFSKVDYPVPQIAGKTGTTTDCVDAWFIGYTPDLVLAVWVGFDAGNHSLGPSMTGGTVAVPGWCHIMDGILRTRSDWKMTFDKPTDIVLRDIMADGTLASPGQEDHGDHDVFPNVPFIKGTEPK
jgi:penicillin-binding protein 1A